MEQAAKLRAVVVERRRPYLQLDRGGGGKGVGGASQPQFEALPPARQSGFLLVPAPQVCPGGAECVPTTLGTTYLIGSASCC